MEGITFSAEAINIIDYLCSKFGVAIDWANVNIIPKLQEIAEHIISWRYYSSMVGVISGALVIIMGIVLLSIGTHKHNIHYDEGIGSMVIGSTMGIVGIPILITHILNMIKCNVFPEMALIDYLLKLKSQYGG